MDKDRQETLGFEGDTHEGEKPLKAGPRSKKRPEVEATGKTEARKPVAANNTLNDLNGAEWKFSTKSVINKPYPLNMQHKLRSQHGGQKPPQLCADIIKIFTKKNQKVLDPFGGVGGTLLGAALVDRFATGIELETRWIEIYKEVSKLENLPEQEFIQGDSRDALPTLDPQSFDFILTDVPYWNIDKLTQTRSKNARSSKLTAFNSATQQTKEQWLDEMESVLNAAARCLKDGKYAAIFIGDMYREGQFHMLAASLANRLESSGIWTLKANLIWYDVSKLLHVYGYPSAFVPSMIHQNIIILKKNK
jgi:DNA modification methylase